MSLHDSTNTITYTDLKQKLKSRNITYHEQIFLSVDNDIKRIMSYQHISFGSKIPEALVMVNTDLQDYWFEASFSDKYKDFCNTYGVIGVDTKIVVNADTITLIPDVIETNDYTFADVWQNGYQNGIECFCISNNKHHGHAIFHNNQKLPLNGYRATLGCDKIIGIYNNMPIYSYDDKICIATPDGAAYIGVNPEPLSESGRVKITINGNNVIVEEYVYYDCSHHHGGWETETYDINTALQSLTANKKTA